MENRINIAEILKNCPSGMELDCNIFRGLEFDRIDENNGTYPIIGKVKLESGYYNTHTFTEYGCYSAEKYSKCVIFPKGKTTWEGFVPSCKFKDGDILATDLGSVFYLNTRLNTNECYGCYVGIGGDGSFHICEPFAYKECCGLATAEEKQKLFKAIKENGYHWNTETKTLEKLIEPEFNVGDWIIRNNKYTGIPVKVVEFNGYYSCELNGEVVNLTRNDVHNNFHLWTINDAKDGDVLVDKYNNIGIFQECEGICWHSYIYLGCDGKLRGFSIGGSHEQTNTHPATKEQRDLLFQKIKEAGYKLNTETKTLEKLVELKFKVGDRVKSIPTGKIYIIDHINENGYIFKNEGGVGFTFEDDWLYELVSHKFDISTLNSYDKVLVRLTKDSIWHATFFSHYDKEVKWGCYPFVTTSSKSYPICIPYKGNEHLTGKKDDCDEFYKTWE